MILVQSFASKRCLTDPNNEYIFAACPHLIKDGSPMATKSRKKSSKKATKKMAKKTAQVELDPTTVHHFEAFLREGLVASGAVLHAATTAPSATAAAMPRDFFMRSSSAGSRAKNVTVASLKTARGRPLHTAERLKSCDV